MSFLDEIIGITEGRIAPAPVPASIPTMDASNAPALYRGYGADVAGYRTTDELLQRAGLNWRVAKRPVVVDGRIYEPSEAVVREDTGDVVCIASSDFKLHQNSDMVAGLETMADALGVKVIAGGYLPTTGRVFLQCRSDVSQDISGSGSNRKVGDIVALEVMISGGHKPGTPFKVRGMARRLVCTNGATIAVASRNIRITHRRSIGAQDVAALRQFSEQLVSQFQDYASVLSRASATQVTPAINQAFLAELTAPGLLAHILDVETTSGSELLERIIGLDEQQNGRNPDWMLDSIQHAKRSNNVDVPRILNQIVDAQEVQPGARQTRGTLAHAYHGTTYYVDHLRGRAGSAAVESAIDGAGDQLKTRAYDLVREWTSVLA